MFGNIFWFNHTRIQLLCSSGMSHLATTYHSMFAVPFPLPFLASIRLSTSSTLSCCSCRSALSCSLFQIATPTGDHAARHAARHTANSLSALRSPSSFPSVPGPSFVRCRHRPCLSNPTHFCYCLDPSSSLSSLDRFHHYGPRFRPRIRVHNVRRQRCSQFAHSSEVEPISLRARNDGLQGANQSRRQGDGNAAMFLDGLRRVAEETSGGSGKEE